MTHPIRSLIPLIAALLMVAASASGQPPAKADMRAEIARRLEVNVEDVRPSPVPGLYEIRSGAEVGYVSTDGRFYVDGDVFDMQSKQNLTESRRQQGRLALLAKISDADTIVFAPAGDAKGSRRRGRSSAIAPSRTNAPRQSGTSPRRARAAA